MKYHIEFDIDFKRNQDKGKYIALEGIDGSGKTTQVEKLYEYFCKQGREVVKTREPRKQDGIIGKLIQEILLGKTKVPSIAFQYLFTADRVMHYEELILPALKKGKIVLSDRCFWSAIPYGIMDRGGDLDENTAQYILVAQSILSMYHQFTVPDFTFYLDIPLDTAMTRIDESPDAREIYEDKKKLAKTIGGYKWLLKQFPTEFIIVNGRNAVEEVTTKIITGISL
jgi:dTMP kinase